MTKTLKLVNEQVKRGLSLHPDAMTILFEHRRHIKNIFLQVKGLLNIDYLGLTMIDPDNQLVAFSAMPHLEYNLIHQTLWEKDPGFSSNNLSENVLYEWQDLLAGSEYFELIKEIKLTSNNFTLGVTLCRRIQSFCFLYSFATRLSTANLKEYYASKIFDLIDIGDYFCKSVLEIYSNDNRHATLPALYQLTSKASHLNLRSRMKLVVNRF